MTSSPPDTTVNPPRKTFFRRMFHWGPLIAVGIVGTISSSALYCHLQWWPPTRSLAGLLDILIFLLWIYQCLSNLFRAAHVGPGYVPLKWRPEKEDESKLQFCKICDGFKVPRSHHCRKCNRCVMKMDHHCPWINNCCGYRNQYFFIQFLLFAVIGCIHATLILGPSIYRAVFRVWYIFYGTGKEPVVELGLGGLFAAIFSFGLAVGVVVSVGFLFFVQMRTVLRNRTGIEEYIVCKALHRQRDDQFTYPYDLGWKENFKLVFTWDGEPSNDGIFWPVVNGCDQFTFTIEQIKQKEEKREHAVKYTAVGRYNGAIFLSFLKFGCKVHCCQPMTEETRLSLSPGDHVMVTRWRRHWLYGEKLDVAQERATDRGWFPRRCVVEEVDERSSSFGDEQEDRPDEHREHSADRDENHVHENHTKYE